MKYMAAAACMALAMSLAPARADTIWEVEHARANARAGGPTNANDAELLERWGCLSGTASAFCQRIRHGANSATDYYRAGRRVRR